MTVKLNFFKGIIAKQFRDLKLGDRFFYDHESDVTTSFTSTQLAEIKTATLARLICDNTDVEYVQLNPFLFSDKKQNPMIDCDKMLKVSYFAWQ